MSGQAQRDSVRADSVRAATETVAVVGLGYVGLPVAQRAKAKEFLVVGYDVDAGKVGALRAGDLPEATADASALRTADVIIVAVPTPVDEHAHPDLGPVKSAVETVARHAKSGVLLSIESTINPGVCEEVVVPVLTRLGRNPENGDLFLVHCPERVNPGDERWTVQNIPRVLGGLTEEATERGLAFYGRLIDAPVRRMSSIRAAEAVKIVENAFRDINIAFVNELAQSFDRLGIDVVEVIEGAKTKPFAFLAHYPGAGVGGHCIPVDPYYLIEHARNHGFEHKFLKLAREINKSMPRYTVERLKGAWGVGHGGRTDIRGVRVALLGLAYKRDVGDLRESPALEIEKILRAEGADVTTYDPFVPDRSTARSLQDALHGSEALVIATDHTAFRNLRAEDLAGTPVHVVVDGRNCLDRAAFRAAGYTIVGIGR